MNSRAASVAPRVTATLMLRQSIAITMTRPPSATATALVVVGWLSRLAVALSLMSVAEMTRRRRLLMVTSNSPGVRSTTGWPWPSSTCTSTGTKSTATRNADGCSCAAAGAPLDAAMPSGEQRHRDRGPLRNQSEQLHEVCAQIMVQRRLARSAAAGSGWTLFVQTTKGRDSNCGAVAR